MMKGRFANDQWRTIPQILSQDRVRIVLLFMVWFFYFIFSTLHPFDFSIDQVRFHLASGLGRFLHAILYGEFVDVLGNVILFLPLGIVGFLAASSRPQRKIRRDFRIILGVGMVMSVGVESLQLFLPDRSCAVFDVLANGLGTALGFRVWEKWGDAMKRAWRKVWSRPSWRMAILAICAMGVIPWSETG
jgi:glycopeptide antibiotics resistance protein